MKPHILLLPRSSLFGFKVASTQVRFNSSLDELKKVVKQGGTKENEDQKFSAISTIDSLLKEGAGDGFGSGSGSGNSSNNGSEYMFGNSVPHPRDVASGIRLQGPIAGRTIDVQYGNLGRAISGVLTVIRSNRIRYFKKVQTRYIRPAKYQKQRRREWWRKTFSHGFKELMSQVRDAKRRGY